MRLCVRPIRRVRDTVSVSGETIVEDAACVATSCPGLAETVNRLAEEAAITVDE